jgi:hypothetical protein
MEPSNSDLAVQLARVEGKLDGFVLRNDVMLESLKTRLEDGARERVLLRQQVDSLIVWRAWVTGIGSSGGLVALGLSVWTTLKTAHVIP